MKNNKLEVISADFGYGMTKAYNGLQFLGIPSIIGEPTYIKFNPNLKHEDISKPSLTWINCEIDNIRRFVGDLALKQSSLVYQILDKDKIKYDETSYLMKAAIGLIVPNNSEIFLITGLPVAYYDENQKNALREKLMGKHIVRFDWDRNNTYKYEVKYDIKDIKIIPQPMGTFFDFILDEKGNINKEILSKLSEDFFESSVGIIDIGYGTTDFCVIKELEYIERSSGSLDKAMGTVFEIIANEMIQYTGMTIPLHVITDAVIKKGKISIEGKIYDLKDITNKALKAVYEEIFISIKAAWRTEYQIDYYIITGGGSIAMRQFFQEDFGKKAVLFTPKSPVFSNVIGYWKYKMMEERNENSKK